MTTPTDLCSHCNGVGSIILSLCCGRGCVTCVGEQMQAVECFSCAGSGSAGGRRETLAESVDAGERDPEVPR